LFSNFISLSIGQELYNLKTRINQVILQHCSLQLCLDCSTPVTVNQKVTTPYCTITWFATPGVHGKPGKTLRHLFEIQSFAPKLNILLPIAAEGFK